MTRLVRAEKIAGMATLPRRDDLTSLVLRTDFSDDTAWTELKAAIDSFDEHRRATFVSNPAFSGIAVQALIDAGAAGAGDDKPTYLFVADTITMTDDEHPLLAVDLYDEPGRAFRVPPRWYAYVSDNLAVANMNFAEYADETDESGTYRGFDE
jgi:hypothetical protein